MVRRFAMAAGTLYPVDDFPVTVERAGFEFCARRVAVQAIGRDRAAQIGRGVALVPGREIPSVTVGVIANWRLVKVLLVLEGETAAHAARAQ